MDKKKTISIISILFAIVSISIATVSYAWIKRDWSPSVYSQDDITVTTSGSLAIKIATTDSTEMVPTDTVDLNTVLKLSDIKLTQVSNSTGLSDDFFGVNFDENPENGKLYKLVPTDKTADGYRELGKTEGYIEVRFLLYGTFLSDDNYVKRVFLDAENSYIKNVVEGTAYEAKDALRISITASDFVETATSVKQHYIIKVNDPDSPRYQTVNMHSGITAHQNDQGDYDAEGKNIYTYVGGDKIVDTSLLSSTPAYTIDDLSGGTYDLEGHYQPDASKELFSITSQEVADNNTIAKWVTLRIWLEGSDSSCVDAISGQKLKVKITFKSADVIVADD